MTSERSFSDRFENWRRWCLQKSGIAGQTGSAEGNYRSPQIWDPPGPKPDWLLTMDVNDALKVNRAFLELGEETRKDIQTLFFKTMSANRKAQEIGCHYLRLGEEAHRLKKMLENRLHFLERRHKLAVKVVVRVKPCKAPDGELLSLKEPA